MAPAKIIQAISGLFLCVVFIGGWGYAVGAYDVFPAAYLKPLTDDFVAFVDGGEGEQTTLTDKVLHDFFGWETRLAGHAAIDKMHNLELKPVSDPRNLMARTKTKLYYATTEGASGYYFFTTVMNFKDSVYTAVLLRADGELIRLYKVPKESLEERGIPDSNHGGITEDGYVVQNPYKSLLATDFCGRTVFENLDLGWHHDISGGDGIIWAWQDDDVVKLDAESGRELHRFSLLDLIAANSDISIFEPRLIKSHFKGSIGQWKYDDILSGKITELDKISLFDPFHQNDVDVLTEDKAKLFPMFSAGDLLLSFRSINLVVVVDPESLKVKWHSFGAFSRQHDPDWSPTGQITVFDNQSHNFNSRVVSLDPISGESAVILDGSKHGLFKFSKGSHQVDPDGSVLVDNMAETAHFSPDGDVIFYVKTVSPQGRDMEMGVVSHITQSEFDRWNAPCN